VGLSYSQTDILKHDVVLIERIDVERQPMKHLSCVAFLRPTLENANYLADEIKNPKYGEYYVCM
jgi:vacuolar protein sorting-associated protein 45